MPAESDRLLQRGDKILAVRTGAHVLADLPADGDWQLMIQIRREAPQHLQALGFGMSRMRMRSPTTCGHRVL